MLVAIPYVSNGQQKDITDYINPMIGASTSQEAGKSGHGLGKTFPGATTPYGLVQLSPDTKTGGDNGPGYSWHHNTIEGFSFIHMSGIGWYGDFGNFLVTPTTGALHTFVGADNAPYAGYRSRYSHNTEVAKAGYYAVTLDNYHIRTELTAAPHAGMMRITYPKCDTARISFDLARRIGGSSTEQYIKVLNDTTFEGWMHCTPQGGGWGNGEGKVSYTVFFYCRLSRPLNSYGVWSAVMPDKISNVSLHTLEDSSYQRAVATATIMRGCREYRGGHLGFFTEFPVTKEGEQVLLKVGISFVSQEGARLNLEHDIGQKSFDVVRSENNTLWRKALQKVEVKGTERDKEIFYTALYHTMVDPRDVSDVDGRYVGGDGKIHTNGQFVYRSIFSGWDVFRSQFPLQTIINPRMVNDEINSLIGLAEASGREYYPRWEIMNSYSGCMLGNPAISVIADAYAKGIRSWDIKKGYKYCINTTERFGNGALGYTPLDISRTLEYAYSDWCISALSMALEKKDSAELYKKRSLNYKNIWNEKIRWFCGRNSDGTFAEWRGELTQDHYCTESNPLQQGWFVPHDVYGFIRLLGKKNFIKKLTSFFDSTSANFLWNNYYNHSNEPVHHIPFLFTYTGNGWLTQKWTRKICENAYGTDVLGLCGNEDVGQMSAWYVLSACGFHPVNPGDNIYIITSPIFDEVAIHLDHDFYKGNIFKVKTINNSKNNIYIQSVMLNGKKINRLWITHQEITDGGMLELKMGSTPNRKLGLNKLPPSLR